MRLLCSSEAPEGVVQKRSERGKGVRMAVKDPVCGMTIEEDHAVGTSEYNGTTYYFCSKDCKEEFDENPEDYAD